MTLTHRTHIERCNVSCALCVCSLLPRRRLMFSLIARRDQLPTNRWLASELSGQVFDASAACIYSLLASGHTTQFLHH